MNISPAGFPANKSDTTLAKRNATRLPVFPEYTLRLSGVKFGQKQERPAEIPWPDVPDELVEALRQVAVPPEKVSPYSKAFYDKLAAALSDEKAAEKPDWPENDRIIHALYGHVELDRLCELYGIDRGEKTVEIPDVATLLFKPNLPGENLRETLAKAIREIPDEAQKLQWIRFMMQDPYVHVRSAATTAYTSLQSPEKRDEFARDYSAHLDSGIRYGVMRGLPSVSAPLRWQIVRDAINDRNPDVQGAVVRDALPSFFAPDDPEAEPRTAVLKAWYQDMQMLRELREQLDNYDPAMKDRRRFSFEVISEHESVANEIARDIRFLKNATLQNEWREQLQELAAGDTPLAELAGDALTWLQARDLCDNYETRLLALSAEEKQAVGENILAFHSGHYDRNTADFLADPGVLDIRKTIVRELQALSDGMPGLNEMIMAMVDGAERKLRKETNPNYLPKSPKAEPVSWSWEDIEAFERSLG